MKELADIGIEAYKWLGFVAKNCEQLKKIGDDPLTEINLFNGRILIEMELESNNIDIKMPEDHESLKVSAKDWIADQLDIVAKKLDEIPKTFVMIDGALLSFNLVRVDDLIYKKKIKIKV